MAISPTAARPPDIFSIALLAGPNRPPPKLPQQLAAPNCLTSPNYTGGGQRTQRAHPHFDTPHSEVKRGKIPHSVRIGPKLHQNGEKMIANYSYHLPTDWGGATKWGVSTPST